MMKLIIVDCFEIKAMYQGNHEPGLVVVASAETPLVAESTIGKVLVVTTTGGLLRFVVSEAKQHGERISFFLPGLVLGDVSRGSVACLEFAATI